jgi:3-deoxy-manno-octulosonate cytidylyltransferase (CMP-KDO synthetase)
MVATDDDRIVDFCSGRGIPHFRTGQHNSGTDRLIEVVSRTSGEFYINIQGDEPTVRPEHLDALVSALKGGVAPVATLRVALDPAEAANVNVVKVVTGLNDLALYFSRLPIPFFREARSDRQVFKHLGLYGYRREALIRFHSLPPSRLELAERLEQLRFLENGVPIVVPETPFDTIGVDTLEDLERAIRFFSGEQRQEAG